MVSPYSPDNQSVIAGTARDLTFVIRVCQCRLVTDLLKNCSVLEVSADDLRAHLANYIGQVMYADRVVLVKKDNRDAAIILSPRMFDRIVMSSAATREDRAAALKRLDAILSRVPADLDPEETQVAVQQTVRAAKAEKRKRKL